MRFLFSSFLIAGALGAIAACGSSGASSTTTNAALPEDAGEGGLPREPDGGAAVGGDPGSPGDPVTTGSTAAIQVVINGQLRSFDGVAAWSQSFPDGGTQNGFQTNSHDSKGWTILLAIFGDRPGTYDCLHGGGLGVFHHWLADGGYDPVESITAETSRRRPAPSRSLPMVLEKAIT